MRNEHFVWINPSKTNQLDDRIALKVSYFTF